MLFLKILFKIWSLSPLMAVTDDSKFGTIEYPEFGKIRFSLINLMLGNNKLYFITFSNNCGKFAFKIFFKLNLEAFSNFNLEESELNEKVENYEKHILSIKSQNQRICEKEFILYHINNQEKRMDISFDKINTYLNNFAAIPTILLALVSIIATINQDMISNYLKTLTITESVTISLIIYSIVNLILLIFKALKVKAYNKSSFGDLKIAKNKEIKLISSYYYDWQQIKRKADLAVSYVLNIQFWLKAFSFFILMLTLIIIKKNI